MKLFWQNLDVQGEGDALLANLLVAPAAKLAQIERQRGNLYFKCLGLFVRMDVPTLAEAKRLAEVKFRSVLRDIQIELQRDLPDERVVDHARAAG